MADKERGRWGDSCDQQARAASPIVGIILLFALVMMGAMLVFVAGSAMFDALESEANQERAQQFMTETDHRLSTVAETKKDQILPTNRGAETVDVVDDGYLKVSWYANGSDPRGDSDCSAGGKLGALEFEQDGGTIAHQGGGIWEQTSGRTAVVSEPQIGYDGERLQLRILQLDETNINGSELVARSDHSRATALTKRINDAAERCAGSGNVAIRIENSTYHDGWYRFLENALGEDEYDEVSVTHTGDVVEVRISEIREVDRPRFIVAEDNGLSGPGSTDLKYNHRVEYGDLFTVVSVIKNIGPTSHAENVSVSIWDERYNTRLLSTSTEVDKLSGNSTRTIDGNDLKFNYGGYESKLEPGETYRYVIKTESGDKTDNPPGSFYVGESGTVFDVMNGSATVTDDTVTISADLQNVGIESGSQDVTLKLDYQDDLPDDISDPYGMIGGKEITRSFGESDPVEFTLNGSKLIDGQYEATVRTDDTTETVLFNVTTGLDPGRVGLGSIEDANVTVEVIGSQVSGTSGSSGHQLAPMTLDVVANGGTVHSFTNPNGGDNVNIGPTWQDKSDASYRYEFTVDEETDLTLRNTRYSDGSWQYDLGSGWKWFSTCGDGRTDPATLPHYSGPPNPDLVWCNDVPAETEFGPIDASQGKNLQNVRVRSAENNTIPALPAGAGQQMTATEILQEQGLIKASGDELDLDSGEFIFLFDNTAECGAGCDEDDIDALWDRAVSAYENNPDQTNDPDFNDLIVYVEVERAGVDPGKPGIAIQPGDGGSTDVGTGDSRTNETGTGTVDTGVDVDTDSIVIG